MSQDYFDKQAVADRIGKCTKTVDNWVRSGRLPPPRPSGLWKGEELEQYLDHGGPAASESAFSFTPEAIRERTARAVRAHRG